MARKQPVFHTLRELRRSKGLRQSEVARQIDCSQSAISKFEGGRLDALADEKIRQLADLLGVKLGEGDLAAERRQRVTGVQAARSFCSSAWCPSAIPYRVQRRVCILPTMISWATARGGAFCDLCGEPLVHACPGCGKPVAGRAFCPLCNSPYVEVEPDMAAELERERASDFTGASDLAGAAQRLTEWQPENREDRIERGDRGD